jgi:hypothetical protein
MMPGLGLFLTKVATKAGIQLPAKKTSFFGRLLTGILHKKRWPANHESKINLKLLTFQS